MTLHEMELKGSLEELKKDLQDCKIEISDLQQEVEQKQNTIVRLRKELNMYKFLIKKV